MSDCFPVSSPTEKETLKHAAKTSVSFYSHVTVLDTSQCDTKPVINKPARQEMVVFRTTVSVSPIIEQAWRATQPVRGSSPPHTHTHTERSRGDTDEVKITTLITLLLGK